jgi:hypothetical protein
VQFAGNKDIADNATREDIKALLWITYLTQPVYFGSNGYEGNGENIPSGFTSLTAIEPRLSSPVPDDIRQLEITP